MIGFVTSLSTRKKNVLESPMRSFVESVEENPKLKLKGVAGLNYNYPDLSSSVTLHIGMTNCWKDWSLAEFYADLENKKISPSIIDTIQKETGSIQKDLKVRHILPLLTIDELISRNLRYDDCLMLVQYLEKLDQKTKPLSSRLSKLYCDPIHGHIELHPACQMIVDTPQFQRLRFIKQLGMVYYVYPGASHNRFEHSLGVCHLAGEFARSLQQNQPFLGITDKDILCIQIAGLCQDLGRGPFSRVFIDYSMPAMHPGKQFKKPCLEVFNHLIEVNSLKEKLKHFGLDDKDILFIQENISGPKSTGSTAWPYKGRREDKAYLYEIVSNKRNGIDVYKWDYLARDCHHLGLANNFDSLRYMKLARVVEEDGEVQICVRDKEIGNLYSMFYTRYNLDKCAYKNRVSYGLEIMVTEALILADDHVTYKGKNKIDLKLSECYEDMLAFTDLTDNVLFKILYTPGDQPKLKLAKSLIERIFKRDIYKCVHESKPMKQNNKQIENQTEEELQKEIIEQIQDPEEKSECEKNIIVKKVVFDFGMKDANPVERLKVYSKNKPFNAKHSVKTESSIIMTPETFKEMRVRVYSRDRLPGICRSMKNAAKCVLKIYEAEQGTPTE
ncbi:SAM domain and HD [Bulinus truncatus]|nr:SAM domain and HD [Bulinus truncatus]